MNGRHYSRYLNEVRRIRRWLVHDAGCVECRFTRVNTREEVKDYIIDRLRECGTQSHKVRIPRSILRYVGWSK